MANLEKLFKGLNRERELLETLELEYHGMNKGIIYQRRWIYHNKTIKKLQSQVVQWKNDQYLVDIKAKVQNNQNKAIYYITLKLAKVKDREIKVFLDLYCLNHNLKLLDYENKKTQLCKILVI